MKQVSVILTVYNEEDSITPLLLSLVQQTLKPNEIIIADAGSTDHTRERISDFQQKHPELNMVILTVPGYNRSQGRNEAIRAAKNEFIAVIDAGCVAKIDWLERLLDGFELTKVAAVAGFYATKPKNSKELLFSHFLAVQPNRLDVNTFLPSSRSLAFKKSIWKHVGGYPENLTTCEDLVFARSLKATGLMNVEPKALVYWELPKTYAEFFWRVSGYAQGDVEARYWPHLKKHMLVWFRYVICLWLPLLFLLYIFAITGYKLITTKLPVDNIYRLMTVQLLADFGIMVGDTIVLIAAVMRLNRQ